MFASSAWHRSLLVYHLHMGGPDADAGEWRALLAPRFAPRLQKMGVAHVSSAAEADVVVVTGLLLTHNLEAVLGELARVPSPAVLVAAGDAAINGGAWAKLSVPGLAEHPLAYYADIHISVPGDPPTPQALIAAIAAAGKTLARPAERVQPWADE